ncbi:hypothetical protein [Glutamicibacter halophytocola]|uniref:hypothetical protein n=1 Tax=Glutamicibacter halophytocola TaxID=1933880 RepID=UPI0015C55383|nr:hypothetical protein [Glutamicibacter halophytocola]NQD42375.1 hypothetical protein [Glutamicibacter halophytocola]
MTKSKHELSSSKEDEVLQILGKTVHEWHELVTSTPEGEPSGHLRTPSSRYGYTAEECGWWAVAALSIYEKHYGEPDEASLFLEFIMSQVVNDDEQVGGLIAEYQESIPEEILEHLQIEGEVQ